MDESMLELEKKLLNRNKWTYSLGGIGRDMVYSLVATFFITYIQFAGLGLTTAQFSVIGILLVLGRVWDAINDPIMGSIVENTHTKWGKFKPWILTGAVSAAIVILFMFNFRPQGWNYVIFFGIIYFIWAIAFTLNDIPFWSLLPNLARKKADRDMLSTYLVVFSGVGAFIGSAVVTLTTVGNAVKGYSIISITFAIFFVMCTLLTVIGVKEPKEDTSKNHDHLSIKGMFSVIKNNDQLLWAALALLLYTVGSGLLVALGYNFFYIELGYNGLLVTIFIVTFGVSNIAIQSFYAKLANKFTRNQLLFFSLMVTAVGYLFMMLIGFVGFLPINIITACIFGGLIFAGQAIFYMALIINMTNTIEYNEYKTGKRNEAVIFSLRPFIVKFSSALQQGLVTLVLIVSGIYALSQNVSQLENQKNYFDAMTTVQEQIDYKSFVAAGTGIESLDSVDLPASQIQDIYSALAQVTYEDTNNDGLEEMVINNAADFAFMDQSTFSMRFILRLAITVVPLILLFGSYFILRKKFFITEEYYSKIMDEMIERSKIEVESKTATE